MGYDSSDMADEITQVSANIWHLGANAANKNPDLKNYAPGFYFNTPDEFLIGPYDTAAVAIVELDRWCKENL